MFHSRWASSGYRWGEFLQSLLFPLQLWIPPPSVLCPISPSINHQRIKINTRSRLVKSGKNNQQTFKTIPSSFKAGISNMYQAITSAYFKEKKFDFPQKKNGRGWVPSWFLFYLSEKNAVFLFPSTFSQGLEKLLSFSSLTFFPKSYSYVS